MVEGDPLQVVEPVPDVHADLHDVVLRQVEPLELTDGRERVRLNHLHGKPRNKGFHSRMHILAFFKPLLTRPRLILIGAYS